MHVEPSPSPDGSCNHWHYYRQADLVATLERSAKGKWTVILRGGAEVVCKTRRTAIGIIMANS